MLRATSLLPWTVLALTFCCFAGAGSATAQAWSGPTALGIQVEDKKGNAVEGAEVVVSFVEVEPFAGPPQLLTDAAGFVELIRLAEGRWRIDVRRDGRAAYTAVVRIAPGKKPLITAGPIRDATTAPLNVKFLKSPDAPKAENQRGGRRSDRDRGQDRAQDRRGSDRRGDSTRDRDRDRRDRPETPSAPPIPPPVKPTPPPAKAQPVKPAPAPALPKTEAPKTETPPQTLPKREASKPETPKPEAPKAKPSVVEAPKVETPKVEAPKVETPRAETPKTTAPAPAAPKPATAAQPSLPEAAAEPAPAPVSLRREIRAFTDPACPGCKAGEWAMIIEQDAAAGAKDCPRKLSRLQEALRGLLDARSAELPSYEGSLLDLLPAADATAISGYTGPGSACQVVVAALPEGSKFAGYGYEVRDASGGGACQVGQECSLGKCRWLDHPAIEKAGETTLVYGVFENRDPNRPRTGRMILYFQPPRDLSNR